MFLPTMGFKTYMINEELHEYSSTQVNLPHELSDKIIAWGEEHVKDKDIFHDPEDPTFGREYEPHVTLLYGLHLDTAEKVRDVLKNTSPFTIKLGKISIFDTKDKLDVVKIEVICDELHQLNKLLSKLPCEQMYPSYKPHVTIAYVNKGKANNLVGNKDFYNSTFLCETIFFSSKTRKKTPISLKTKVS